MDQAVTGRKREVLGRAVFGTASGLFADGEGVLEGAEECFSIFEFGRGFDRVDVLPQNDETIMFRRPAVVDHRQQIDLLGFLQGTLDASNRPGYLGACVATPPGEIGPNGLTSDWESAYREALTLLENVKPRLLDREGKMRAISSVRLFSERQHRFPRSINPASDRSELSVYWRDEQEPLRPEEYDLFQILSTIPGKGLTTTALVGKERPGVISLKSPRVKKVLEEFEQRLKREQMRVQRKNIKGNAVSQQEAPLILSGDVRTGERRVSNEHRDLLHRMSELEYEVEELRSIVRALQREVADRGMPPKYYDQFAYRENSRFSFVKKITSFFSRRHLYVVLLIVFLVAVVSFAIGIAVDTGLVGGNEIPTQEDVSQRSS